jgi:hypothetical protein
MVLGALFVLRMEASAQVPIMGCYCDAVTLAALIALCVGGCSAQTSHSCWDAQR